MPVNFRSIYKSLYIPLVAVGLASCEKLLEVPTPPQEIYVQNSFNDSSSAVAAIASIYAGMITHGFFEWSGISYNAARSADDAVYHSSIDFFGRDSLLYTNADILSMWKQGFSSLLMVNTCIAGLRSSTKLSESLHQQLLGEALFCRAFVNFNLVNIWGDAIPLVTTPNVQDNQFAKSVPRQIVYNQIIADLLEAKDLLTPTYAGGGRVRPNSMAAGALLARVYLYQGRYSDAVKEATAVINCGLYTPLPSLESAFLQSSTEAIWQLMPPKNGNTIAPVGDAALYLSSATSLTPQLLASFEPGDRRRQAWIIDNNYFGTTYTTANKYRNRRTNGGTAPTEYYVVLRLAEQYLIRAECNTQLGQVALAVADLNIVRHRANLPDLPPGLTPAQCVIAVEHERQVELFTEWAHRWFDLKRWPGRTDPHLSRADEVLGPIKNDWQSTDQWYPVPLSELQADPFLVQNPGYPIR